jgi:transcriptional regulator with XRE-family HTH domain
MTFATKLAAIRTAAGISQYRLSKESGISKQALSQLELGSSQPSWETVQALCRALGVSCQEFMADCPSAAPAKSKPAAKPKKGRAK